MANNLMFLVSKRTGEKVCIAKYYPDPGKNGWFVHRKNVKELLEVMFHNDNSSEVFEHNDFGAYELVYEDGPDDSTVWKGAEMGFGDRPKKL